MSNLGGKQQQFNDHNLKQLAAKDFGDAIGTELSCCAQWSGVAGVLIAGEVAELRSRERWRRSRERNCEVRVVKG
ncbi:hypothetical protein ACFX13_042071 [Malus domestica]